ncbi:MAG: hypothetical protein ABSF03_31015 [Streptosporangiaceae bacterium]
MSSSGGTWTTQTAPSAAGYTTQLSSEMARVPGTASVRAVGGLAGASLPGPGVILRYGS